MADHVGVSDNTYLYTGQQYDYLTGLYNLRARSYDPATGRFLSPDTYPLDYHNPVEFNRYVYTANTPINFSDPSGYSLVDYGKQLVNRLGWRKTFNQFVFKPFIEGAIASFIGHTIGVFVSATIQSMPCNLTGRWSTPSFLE